MARAKTVYRCTDCGSAAPKWAGRCAGCEAWNTLVEELDALDGAAAVLDAPGRPVPIDEVVADDAPMAATGIDELDRVLHGGLVPGSVTLIGGEPGIGKSTLLLQTLTGLAASGSRCLYVSAEESAQQVRLRAERLGSLQPLLWLVADTALPHILSHLDDVKPTVLAIDSVQTIYDPALASAPGSVAQVRECTHKLVREAKDRGIATLLVGHVTKDGGLAGPRVLEHLVDTVLSFEGDRHHALRLLRAVKHRYGATDELGLFEMTETGLSGVPDPSALFLADRRRGIAGSIVAPIMDGHRPLLVEIQALVMKSQLPVSRRSAQGLEQGRLGLLLAVIERRLHQVLAHYDVHTVAAGGVKVVEPGADLAVALAIISAYTDCPVADDLVACGEVGLGGEIRQVGHTARRLAEAARLGFRHAVVPMSAPEPPAGITALRAPTLHEAVVLAGLA
jgi:DNA repair protein RadA/Sms